MGWNNSVFPLLIVTPTGGFTGLFVYSPGLGAGHLTESIAAANGTDPYGNAFLSGNVTYAPGSPAFAWQQTGATINFYSAPSEAGPWTLLWQLVTDTVTNNALLLRDVPFELQERAVPTAATGIGSGPSLFGNTSGQLGYVSDANNGDSNTYDTGRLTLVSAGVTINSTTTPGVTIFSHHLGVGTYEIEVWLVTQNTTAADNAIFQFSGVTAGANALVDGQITQSGATVAVNYFASTTYSTPFSGQGVAGNQRVHVLLTLPVTAAGTLLFSGKESVAGNTITVSAGSRMRICPVVAT